MVQRITKAIGLKKTFSFSFIFVAISFFLSFAAHSFLPFLLSMFVMALANGIVAPLTNTILSAETDERSQGSTMGLGVSYASIGQILGPIIGGAVATIGVSYPFIAGALFVILCYFLSLKILVPSVHKEHSS